MRNTLYYGDNLPILREHVAAESVDLIYLDPPFNSNRSYNVLFKSEGKESEAQIKAFDDTWHWAGAAATYHELATRGPLGVRNIVGALHGAIGENQMMAYLVMMAARLVELRRVLKPTGSLYLHCDPTASHYLKVLLDTIFDVQHFRNEIVWRRYGVHNDVGQGSKHFGRVHDIILLYSKSENPRWQQQFTPLRDEYVESTYRLVEPESGRRYMTTPLTGPGGEAKGNPVYEWNGHTRAWRYSKETMEQLHREGRLHYSKTGYIRQKHYLDESRGVPVQDVWDDVSSLSGMHEERLGYPTQKPLALLERIISASSNPGDVVLDPFCGCGTAVHAAQKLGRQWIGIDITHLSIALLKYRLKTSLGLEPGKDYDVIGEPADLQSARQLAQDDRYQFQWWALSLIEAQPLGGEAGSKKGKKGADKGVDGIVTFIDDATNRPKSIVVQVKSGGVNSGTVRDLRGVVEREGAALGVLLTLEPPSAPMLNEAAAAGFYESPWGKAYPRLQILTVEGLLRGAQRLQMPPQEQTAQTFKQAPKEKGARPRQPGLGVE